MSTCGARWSSDPKRRCQAPAAEDAARCLAHVDGTTRRRLLQLGAEAGAITLQHAEVSSEVFYDLLHVLRSIDGAVVLDCEDAHFLGSVELRSAAFARLARFTDATFHHDADFGECGFAGRADFERTTFIGAVSFERARFADVATFAAARFDSSVTFAGAHFDDTVDFDRSSWPAYRKGQLEVPQRNLTGARFAKQVTFVNATFPGAPTLRGTVFEGAVRFDDVDQTNGWEFNRCRFGGDVTLGIAGASYVQEDYQGLTFDAVSWTAPAVLNVGFARVQLKRCVIEKSLAIRPFLMPSEAIEVADTFRSAAQDPPEEYREMIAAAPSGGLPLLREITDCTILAPVTISGVSLRRTSFFGSTGLEQLRFPSPVGWPHRKRWRFRTVIADDDGVTPPARHVRTTGTRRDSDNRDPKGSSDPRLNGPERGGRRVIYDEVHSRYRTRPSEIEAVYRQLRVGLENSKAAPAASDFYVGELNARRRSASWRSLDTWLLPVYRWVGGYGVRPFPPLLWLLGVTTAMAWLLRYHTHWFVRDADPKLAGFQPPTLDGYFVHDRYRDALAFVARNSINLFQAPGLAPIGTFLLVAERYVTVALLTFVVLAVRSRVAR